MATKYSPASMKADEFIHDGEIQQTLAYADEMATDVEYCRSLIKKHNACKVSHTGRLRSS